ncbi:MAG: glutamate racemase [Chloroflexota bacterium]|nr:glutamate racemase [Chloroflexota bacterium]
MKSLSDKVANSAIGVFDSGVGGLSVMKEIAKLLPCEDIIYFADSIHCPYGARSREEIQRLSHSIVRFLLDQGAKLIVVACNTASAVALSHLRATFSVPIVGMEPAVKPAALATRSGKVGVIATQVTFQGELFARLIERFAADVDVYTQVCPGLVERVETGLLNDPKTEELLRTYLRPMLEAGIDSLVLGCTHYPFLRRAIERIVSPGVRVVDPSLAVARQTKWVFEREGLGGCGKGVRIFYTSGDPQRFAKMVERLTGERSEVRGAQWKVFEDKQKLYPKSDLG